VVILVFAQSKFIENGTEDTHWKSFQWFDFLKERKMISFNVPLPWTNSL